MARGKCQLVGFLPESSCPWLQPPQSRVPECQGYSSSLSTPVRLGKLPEGSRRVTEPQSHSVRSHRVLDSQEYTGIREQSSQALPCSGPWSPAAWV